MSNAAIIAACAAASASAAASRSSRTFTEAAEQLGTGCVKSFEPCRKTKRKKIANKRRALAARLRKGVE